MATEISLYLDALIKTNKDAAQLFAKKVAELLSLSRLLEHGDIQLPTISSSLTQASKPATAAITTTGVAGAKSSAKKSRGSVNSANHNVKNSPYASSKPKGNSLKKTANKASSTKSEIEIKSPEKVMIINSLSYRRYLK